jgi:hypothetical protein
VLVIDRWPNDPWIARDPVLALAWLGGIDSFGRGETTRPALQHEGPAAVAGNRLPPPPLNGGTVPAMSSAHMGCKAEDRTVYLGERSRLPRPERGLFLVIMHPALLRLLDCAGYT